MKATFSKIIFGLSWLIALLTVLATCLFVQVVVEQDPIGSLLFLAYVGLGLGGGCFLLSLIPSSIFFFRSRQKRDLWSLSLSGVSFLIILVETIVMYYLTFLKHYPVERSYF